MAKKWPAALRQTCCHRPLRCATSIPPDISLGSIASNPRAPSAPALWFMVADPTAAEFRASGGVRLARELRGKSYGPIELLAEVPIAPSLRGTRPIPAQVERQRRRHSSGGDEATKIALGANRHFTAVGLDRKHWRDAGAIRRIFKQAFERAGLPNYNPHSFRHTLSCSARKYAGRRKSGRPIARILATSAP